MRLTCIRLPGEVLWWHRPGSTLAQVLACCLTAPGHYPNNFWLIKSDLWPSPQSNFTRSVLNLIHNSCSEITLLELLPQLAWGIWTSKSLSPSASADDTGTDFITNRTRFFYIRLIKLHQIVSTHWPRSYSVASNFVSISNFTGQSVVWSTDYLRLAGPRREREQVCW